MAPPIPLELQDRIIAWRHEFNMSIKEIVCLSGRSEKSIFNILSTYRRYNQPVNPFNRPCGRKRILERDDLNFITALLQAQPGLYLDEIQTKLLNMHDLNVSLAIISRSLSRMALTNKTISVEALEHNEHLCATWLAGIAQYEPSQLVFIDEAGVDNHTNVCRNGWSPLGQACVCHSSFLRGQKYSVLPALSLDGIIALDVFEGQ
jgi:hypothetical protein